MVKYSPKYKNLVVLKGTDPQYFSVKKQNSSVKKKEKYFSTECFWEPDLMCTKQ